MRIDLEEIARGLVVDDKYHAFVEEMQLIADLRHHPGDAVEFEPAPAQQIKFAQIVIDR